MIISLEVHRQTQRRREEMGDLIRFHGILPLGEVDVFLVLPRRLQLLLVLKGWQHSQGVLQTGNIGGIAETHCSQPPSDGPRLLWSQIKRKVLLFLVELAKVLAGLLVCHGQHPSNRLANGITTKSKKKNTKQSVFPHPK